MTEHEITMIFSALAFLIAGLMLWASLRESRRQQERARQARAERERARAEFMRTLMMDTDSEETDIDLYRKEAAQ